MKKLTPENAAALTKYAALAGCTPGRFLNKYLATIWCPCLRIPEQVTLKAILGNLEYRTQADAERVTAWMHPWSGNWCSDEFKTEIQIRQQIASC
jgi:hypothetical protein